MKKCLTLWSAFALLVTASACTKSTPARPSAVETPVQAVSGAPVQPASVTDVKTGITLTTPQLVTPSDGQKFQFVAQPLTLTVKNAVATGSTALVYGFQVALDGAFANIVQSKDGVAEGSGGQTSLTLDKLAGAKDYFWRVRAVSGGLNGPFTNGRSFNVGPEVVLQPPVLSAPAQNGTVSGVGILTTNNIARTGPAGPIVYRFEASDSSSFANLVFVADPVPEQSGGQTSVQITAKLTANGTYFWRVRASDPSNNLTTPYSAVFSFKFLSFDWTQATMVGSPPDLAFWPETAKITSIQFAPDSFQVDFDKRTGPNRWPDVAFGSGNLQYTLGICVNRNNVQWFCATIVQFWFGRDLGDSAPPSHVGFEWFYDPGRWGPILFYQPQDGETVGVFVASGNNRDGGNITRATCPAVCERSNVALVPWVNNGFTNYVFSIGNKVMSNLRR